MPVFEEGGFDFAAEAGAAVGGEGGLSIPITPDTSTFVSELESWESSSLTPFIDKPREIVITADTDEAYSDLQDIIGSIAEIQDKEVRITIIEEKITEVIEDGTG